MRKAILPLFMLIGAVSCIDKKDYDLHSIQVNPSLGVPLAFGTLSVQDILKSKDSLNILVDPDSLVYLEYEKELVRKDIRELIAFHDVAINQSFGIPNGTIPAHNKDIRSDSSVEIIDFGLSPEQLSQIDFKQGNISYSATWLPPSASPPPFEVLLTSPAFISKSTGNSLSVTTSGSGTLALSDYNLTLNKNKFNLKIVLVLKAKGSATAIGNNNSVAVNFSLGGNMDFNSIRGFFGDQTVHPPADTVKIGAFGTTLGAASISFAQPSLSLEVINDYGVPCKVTFVKIEARKTGSILALQLNPASPIAIAQPVAMGDSATTLVAVTNAKQVADFGPTEIYYQMSARINQGLPTGSDFMQDKSKMRTKMKVKLPLFGTASGITLRDTVSLDLSKLTESQIQKASLKIDGTNQLPLDANIQVYLLDAQDKLDSLIDSSQTLMITGSTVTAAGDLETASTLTKPIPLDKDKINGLFSAKKLIVVAVLNTSKDSSGNPVDVKFKSNYTLKINLSLLVDLNFNIKF